MTFTSNKPRLGGHELTRPVWGYIAGLEERIRAEEALLEIEAALVLIKKRTTTGGNTTPTEELVREKLTRRGALFASDEVRVLTDRLDMLRQQRDEMLTTIRALQRYVPTGSA